jgi:DnaK suppressor protein
MPSTPHITAVQRGTLVSELRARMATFENHSAATLDGQPQVEHARQTLLQDAEDASQHNGEREVESGVSDILSSEYDALALALARVDDPDYGLCADCGLAIPFDRLRAEPQATRCVDCEAAHEAGA